MKLVYLGDSLEHHGVKGQRWGVRRYQNKDGTLTAAGKKQRTYRQRAISANKTIDLVNDIIRSMTLEDQTKILAGDTDYLSPEQGSAVIKRILKKDGKIPVAFFDMLDDGDTINVIVGTRSGDNYRGKGYATEVVAKGMQWLEKHKELVQEKVVWGVRSDNIPSINLAVKNGFKLEADSNSIDNQGFEWINYSKVINKKIK